MAHSTENIALALDLHRMGKSLKDISEQTRIPERTLRYYFNHSGNARVLVLSDLHCGHRAGLTPPQHQLNIASKWGKLQKEVWDWFERTVENLKPITHCFVMGDIIDGKGDRSGGTEQITTDRNVQIEMACEALALVQAQVYTMVYGTPYHTGTGEDWESQVAYRLPQYHQCHVSIGNHKQILINGICFDLKHKTAGTSVPYGMYTSLAKTKVHNREWAERNGQMRADIFIRGHVHHFDYCGNNTFLSMSLPALQSWGSKYGEKMCEGVVNTGLVWMDIPYHATKLSHVNWHEQIAEFEHQRMAVPDYEHRQSSG